jgi:transcriptional regulator with XRE-family HTH domain
MTRTASRFDRILLRQFAALGREVRQAREHRRLAPAQLARMADVSVHALARIEAGQRGASAAESIRVLRALGLTLRALPGSLLLAIEAARSARHIDSAAVTTALEQAAQAAVDALRPLFDDGPETDPAQVGALLAGVREQLQRHLRAMLCGAAADASPMPLPRLVYSDADVGGPACAPDEACGWALRLREHEQVLQGEQVLALAHPDFEPWPNRAAALTDFRHYVDRCGHPPGVVDAVPVYVNDEDRYTFERPGTPTLTDTQAQRKLQVVAVLPA